MPRAGSHILDTGDRFPELTLSLVGGGTLRLPDELESGWAVLMFYRAHW